MPKGHAAPVKEGNSCGRTVVGHLAPRGRAMWVLCGCSRVMRVSAGPKTGKPPRYMLPRSPWFRCRRVSDRNSPPCQSGVRSPRGATPRNTSAGMDGKPRPKAAECLFRIWRPPSAKPHNGLAGKMVQTKCEARAAPTTLVVCLSADRLPLVWRCAHRALRVECRPVFMKRQRFEWSV